MTCVISRVSQILCKIWSRFIQQFLNTLCHLVVRSYRQSWVEIFKSSVKTRPVIMYVACSISIGPLVGKKKQLFILTSETLIPFKVVSLVMHTLLPAVLPLLETFLESFLWNHVQLRCRVPHNVFSWLKSGPFQRHFQLGEQPKMTRSHVGRVGSLTNQGNVVLGQKKKILESDAKNGRMHCRDGPFWPSCGT